MENLLRRKMEIPVKPPKSNRRENVNAENVENAIRRRRYVIFVTLTKCQIPVHATLAKNVPADRRLSKEALPDIQASSAFGSVLDQLPKTLRWKLELPR